MWVWVQIHLRFRERTKHHLAAILTKCRSSSCNLSLETNQVSESLQTIQLLINQTRGIETERLTPSSGHKILVEQRKRRPVSPHLSIYRLQINYFTSPFHRITGCLLSGAFYCFGAAYLVAQLFGWHLDSATLVAAFGNLPAGAKIAAKFVMAWPLTFHCVNGVGHLIWDTGRRYSKRAIVTQGWTIVGVSLVGAGYLTTMV